VLRSEDGGFLWQTCAMPKGAEKLDFRGVRAFDAQTALVMSSGKGALSKVYKTTDGCATWTLVLDDPDAEGFFDAIWFKDRNVGLLLGDPVDGKFVLMGTSDGGAHWTRVQSDGLKAAPGIGAFAASDSSLVAGPVFATGGPDGPFVYTGNLKGNRVFSHVKVPMNGSTESAGIFSLTRCGRTLVAVGGEYTKPGLREGTAAYFDGSWKAAKTMPGGYRSGVGYDSAAGACVAVGPNGVDVSKDGGVSWRAVSGEATTEWNAVSLPFVVGEKGKIGKLRAGALE
jgi:photosystem II stability/assembly factor-like uncharacterized protein